MDIKLKEILNEDVMSLLFKVSQIMTKEGIYLQNILLLDRADKILPIILENIKEDSDEEKRILGLDLMDRLAYQLGKDIC